MFTNIVKEIGVEKWDRGVHSLVRGVFLIFKCVW